MDISVGRINLKPPRAFKAGDAVSIYLNNHHGLRTVGRVVAVLQLEGWIFEHYVVELEVGAPDPILEVRDGFTTWPDDSVSSGRDGNAR